MLPFLCDALLMILSWALVFVMPVIRWFKAMQKEQDRMYLILAFELAKRTYGNKKS